MRLLNDLRVTLCSPCLRGCLSLTESKIPYRKDTGRVQDKWIFDFINILSDPIYNGRKRNFVILRLVYKTSDRMFRLILFSILLIVAATSVAQQSAPVPLDPDSHMITYREVVQQEGLKDILYDRCAEWVRSYYLSPTSVTKIQDKVNGKIEGTGRFKIYYFLNDDTRMDAGVVLYDIKLELRDNKYRYTLNNFQLKAASHFPLEKFLNKSDPAYNPKWDSYLFQVDTTMRSLIVKLKAGMQPRVIKKDEW
jgi:hypothetical protein